MKKESTPFATLEIETKDDRHIWAKFYWSKNSGTYGHQVITEYNDGKGFKEVKTNGCGFCKKSAALETFLQNITGKYTGLGGDLEYFLNRTKYYIGGNEYRLPLSKIVEITELKKCR